ncbi:MAG: hypothetical protein HW421_444 [Ignavibacteria bacterium]|nr:hypothetical protein [Ignavibacteria bacterium]
MSDDMDYGLDIDDFDFGGSIPEFEGLEEPAVSPQKSSAAAESTPVNRELLLQENKIMKSFFKMLQDATDTGDKTNFYYKFFDLFGLYQVFCDQNNIAVNFPKLAFNKKENMALIITFFRSRDRVIDRLLKEQSSQHELSSKKDMFKSMLSTKFSYNFEPSEYTRLNDLLNELSKKLIDAVGNSSSENFITRLNKRITALQQQLQMKMPSLDEYWGLIGGIGAFIGAYSAQAKPYVDNMKEIINIIWVVQARAEGLGDRAPKLSVNFQEK